MNATWPQMALGLEIQAMMPIRKSVIQRIRVLQRAVPRRPNFPTRTQPDKLPTTMMPDIPTVVLKGFSAERPPSCMKFVEC